MSGMAPGRVLVQPEHGVDEEGNELVYFGHLLQLPAFNEPDHLGKEIIGRGRREEAWVMGAPDDLEPQ